MAALLAARRKRSWFPHSFARCCAAPTLHCIAVSTTAAHRPTASDLLVPSKQVVAASRLGREDLPGLHAIFQHLDAGMHHPATVLPALYCM